MKKSDWIPLGLILLGLIGFSRLSPSFLDIQYLLSSTSLYAETGLLALGSTLVIVSGNIDLSVGSNLVLTACLTAKLLSLGCPVPVAILFALAVGSALGALNGFLVACFRIPSFLVTLGTLAAFRGAAQAMMGPTSVELPVAFKGIDEHGLLGLPCPLVVFLCAGLITGLLLHRTVFGRWTFAVGTNESAALYTGLPVTAVKIGVFAITGLLAGVGALLMDSRLGVARHNLATGMELDAITVAVVGGAAIQGGKASMTGTVLALFLIDVVKTGMGVANVKAEYQLTAIGVLLVTAALAMRLSDLRLSVSRSGFKV